MWGFDLSSATGYYIQELLLDLGRFFPYWFPGKLGCVFFFCPLKDMQFWIWRRPAVILIDWFWWQAIDSQTESIYQWLWRYERRLLATDNMGRHDYTCKHKEENHYFHREKPTCINSLGFVVRARRWLVLVGFCSWIGSKHPWISLCSTRVFLWTSECKSNSTSAQYVTLQIKFGWRTVKTCWLAQQNGSGPSFLHSLLRLVKGTAMPNTYQRRL